MAHDAAKSPGDKLRPAGRSSGGDGKTQETKKATTGRFSMIYKILGSVALLLAVLVLLVVVAWNFHTSFSTEPTFDAPVADVWKVWTDADSVKKWWGPKGY